MKKALVAALLLFVVAAAFLAGRASGPGKNPAPAERTVLYYVDPMNPAHTSERPGFAPCGMKMEPVYADSAAPVPPAAMLPGAVRLNLQKQQLIGLGTGKAEKRALQHTLRLLGKIEPDATRTFQVTAPSEGWITKAMPVAAGSAVRKNETLALLYSPTFISAGQAFRNALEYQDRMHAGQSEGTAQRVGLAEFNVKQYADSLRNLGVSDRQIDDMIRSRKYSEHIEVVSPADGFVMVRNVSEGQRFEKGVELYRVIDLSRVWVVADVFNREAPFIQQGIEARVSIPAQNLRLPARLSDSLPQFDVVTRTLKLRFEMDNPGLVLKPDMFVDIEFDIQLPETVIAPAEAVLDSGLRKTVFVDRGNGYFEPRTVHTGWRVGDYVQITHGLMQDEPIVTSGNFLLDSESRMKLAALGVHSTPSVDPVCGMAVDEAKARAAKCTTEFSGTLFSFCNPLCRQQFESNPTKFLNKEKAAPGDAPPAVAMNREIDPVCGMQVTPELARTASRTALYEGRTFYFCNDSCKEEFLEEPAKFLKSRTARPTVHDQSHH